MTNQPQSMLFTIGYAAHTPSSLFDRLFAKRVEVLIDVRDLPLSRKRGFSKSALAATATERGIEYRHIKALGVPSSLRRRRKDGGVNGSDYMNEFRRILRSNPELLEETLAIVEAKRCCLLCLESDPAECHRTVVANELDRTSRKGLTIEEL